MAASQSALTMTASTCAPKTAHGSHLFKIEGYSMYRGLGVGKYINSATFAVGGYDWCIRFYPDGDRDDSKGWVSVYLVLLTKDAKVRAFYDLERVDQATRPAVFRGLLHFIYKDSLPPMDDLNDDEYEEMLRHLLVAADRYAMERMKLMCESLRAKTVATTLALAD